MSTNDLDRLSMTEAITALRARDLSAVELLHAVHQRYEATEPVVQAWAERYEQEALAQAVVADRRITTGSSAPLLGIPVGIKDIFDVAGKATRCNSALRESAAPAVRDSEPVHRLRQAGAVVLGKTVTQEFAAGVVSAPARNPWDPTRVPGGSSGGSAVAIATSTAFGSIGSDTGGSIRIPASVTGTVGLKPTFGRVPLEGTFPLSGSLDTAGPITRTVADAAAMLLALLDRPREVLPLIDRFDRIRSAPGLAGIRIGVLGGFFTARLQPDVRAAFDTAVSQLEELGAELVEIVWDEADAANAVALLLSRVESAAVHHRHLREDPSRMGDDVRYRFETGALLSGEIYLRARAARIQVRESIRSIFETHTLDAAVAPTTPASAPRADDLVCRYPDGSEEGVGPALTRLTMPWNATGQPVVSVPAGFDRDGLPIGLSFVGRPDADLELAEIAHHYACASGWTERRPDPVDAESKDAR